MNSSPKNLDKCCICGEPMQRVIRDVIETDPVKSESLGTWVRTFIPGRAYAFCNRHGRPSITMYLDGRIEMKSPKGLNEAWIYSEVMQESKVSTKPLTHCQSGKDGECFDKQCPQIRDNEPDKSGRHCPIDFDREGD